MTVWNIFHYETVFYCLHVYCCSKTALCACNVIKIQSRNLLKCWFLFILNIYIKSFAKLGLFTCLCLIGKRKTEYLTFLCKSPQLEDSIIIKTSWDKTLSECWRFACSSFEPDNSHSCTSFFSIRASDFHDSAALFLNSEHACSWYIWWPSQSF